VPVAKSAAPIGGPANWFTVTRPAIRRELAIPRSALSTSIGTNVLDAVSANVSAVPNRNMTTSTTAMFTQPVTIVTVSTVSTTVRIRSTATTTRRRSSRSAMTPAFSPKSSHGRRCSGTAIATSSGSLVWEATSSGPAASVIPSPRLLIHEEASSQRKATPNRRGTTIAMSARSAATLSGQTSTR
jgi:hypothetical protein